MSDNKSLSARETELALLAWRALEDPNPKVDYQKLAELANFKNRNSASACFGPIRKKLLEGGYATASSPSAGGGGSGSSATPKGKRSAAVAAVATGGEDGDDNPTPTKKPRGRPRKKVVAADPAPAAAPVKKEDEDEKQTKEADNNAPVSDDA